MTPPRSPKNGFVFPKVQIALDTKPTPPAGALQPGPARKPQIAVTLVTPAPLGFVDGPACGPPLPSENFSRLG